MSRGRTLATLRDDLSLTSSFEEEEGGGSSLPEPLTGSLGLRSEAPRERDL